MLRDLPARARWYIIAVIALGTATFGLLLPRAALTPVLPLSILIFLSTLTSAFKIQFPIASGSNMSVSYVVDIASLILLGPHTTMIVGAVGAWAQSTFNAKEPNPGYRTLFNMSIVILTIEASGQVFQRLGGSPATDDEIFDGSPLAAGSVMCCIGAPSTAFDCEGTLDRKVGI